MLLGSNYRNDAVEKLYGDRIGDSSIIFTPWDTVENMLDLIPEDFWTPDVTILDMYCKSGRFLVGAFRKLYNSPYLAYLSESQRTLHILNKQLFGLCSDMTCMLLSEANIYGYAQYGKKHIKLVDTYDYNSVVKQRKDGIINRTLEGKFGQMKFDLVIGNPPYNKDAYIDFVEIGHKLATQYSCWVTPAKWQAKGGKKNEQFRAEIVPHMSKIVYYPDTTEIFDISETGGISYYLIDKSEHKIKDISLECKLLPELRHNNSNIDFSNYICMQGNKIRDIITKCNKKESNIADTWDFSQSKYIKNTDRGRVNKIQGDLEVMQGEEVCGYIPESELFTTDDIDKYKVITPVITSGTNPFTLDHKLGRFVNMYCIKPMQVPKGSFLPLFRSYDKDECMSFISYNYCKLVQFLLFFGICGTTTTGNFWRFVPDPIAFDHIFTDEELYKKYNLTPEEINIIESVIKERK